MGKLIEKSIPLVLLDQSNTTTESLVYNNSAGPAIISQEAQDLQFLQYFQKSPASEYETTLKNPGKILPPSEDHISYYGHYSRNLGQP